MSQREAAKKAGIAQSYLSQLETGERNPSTEVLNNLSKVYEIPIAIIVWQSTTKKDVKKDRLHLWEKLKPIIDDLANEFIS